MQYELVRMVVYLSPVDYIVPDRSRRYVSHNDDRVWFPEQCRNFRLFSGLGFCHIYLTVMTINIYFLLYNLYLLEMVIIMQGLFS